ncbi:MAG: leucine-rich repeat domain-containing protein, partial [Clostridia bacterium]|nr:leucine-rich repeat domain-containing protein [Clostridia bacterium]
IPASVTKIGEGAFYSCDTLTKVTIPEGVTEIEEYTLACCEKLETIVLPATIEQIDPTAFYDNKALVRFDVAKNNMHYVSDENGYLFNKDMTELCMVTTTVPAHYEIPASVTKIDAYAFYRRENLTSVVIPDGVSHIGKSAFQMCNLTNVEIPASVVQIDAEAFNNCKQLSVITILGTATKFSDNVFRHCTNLTIKCHPGSPAERHAQNNGHAVEHIG